MASDRLPQLGIARGLTVTQQRTALVAQSLIH